MGRIEEYNYPFGSNGPCADAVAARPTVGRYPAADRGKKLSRRGAIGHLAPRR